MLAVEVRQRALEIDSGKAAVAAADDGVRAAVEAQRVVSERYRAGVITQIEVLDAEFALLQAAARSDTRAGRRAAGRSASCEGDGAMTRGGSRGTPSVQVRHLSRRFGSFVAVNDVSFDVRAGEIFGFLGSNGAGKSTTIRMLCGLLRPTSGTAIVGGLDVSRDPEGVKRANRLHVSALLALRAADRRSEHRVLRRHLRPDGRAARGAPRRSCSTWPACAGGRAR